MIMPNGLDVRIGDLWNYEFSDSFFLVLGFCIVDDIFRCDVLMIKTQEIQQYSFNGFQQEYHIISRAS